MDAKQLPVEPTATIFQVTRFEDDKGRVINQRDSSDGVRVFQGVCTVLHGGQQATLSYEIEAFDIVQAVREENRRMCKEGV